MKVRRPIAALLVVVIVASAGCSGLTGGDGQPTTETTPAPTTDTSETTSATTVEETPEQLAPGLTSEGVTDALALADAHESIVTSSTFVKQKNVTETNGTVTVTQQTRYVQLNDSHWEYAVTGDGMPVALGVTNGTWTVFSDGEVVVYRLQGPENTSYGVANWDPEIDALVPPAQFRSSAGIQAISEREFVYSLFANEDVTVENATGDTVELSGTADELAIHGERATSVEFTATVTNDGLVESVDLTYEEDGTTVERSLTFDTSVEDPLTRPDWYETAIDESPLNATEG